MNTNSERKKFNKESINNNPNNKKKKFDVKMLFYPYFDPFAILYPFFIVMAIVIIIVIIVIIVLLKSIRKNIEETKGKPYQQKSYQSSQQPRPSQPVYQQPEKPISSSASSSMAYCRFCGEKTAKDAAFCPNCGSKL